jgi:TolA-binding protein
MEKPKRPEMPKMTALPPPRMDGMDTEEKIKENLSMIKSSMSEEMVRLMLTSRISFLTKELEDYKIAKEKEISDLQKSIEQANQRLVQLISEGNMTVSKYQGAIEELNKTIEEINRQDGIVGESLSV